MTRVNRQYDITSLYCPIAPAIHPRAEQIEQQAIAWIDKVGLCQDSTERAWAIATNSAEFASRVLPGGQDSGVLLFALWTHLAFALNDDLATDTTKISTAEVVDLSCQIIRALEAPGRKALAGRERIDSALADLVERTWAMCTSVQRCRLTEGIRDWLTGAAWISAHTEHRIMPAVDPYAGMYCSVSGSRFSLAMVEIAHRFEVPAAQWSAPAVRALTEMAGFLTGVTHDILGYDQDDHLDVPEVNIVDIIACQEHCSVPEAAERAARLHDRVMARFLELHAQVGFDAGPKLLDYLDGMTHFVRGVPDWMATAPRYASQRNRNDLPRTCARLPVQLRDVATVKVHAPNIPSIAWWWTV